MREAVKKPLKGTSANLVRYMGLQVEVQEIISTLEAVYGIVASFNVLMQSFYEICQDQN